MGEENKQETANAGAAPSGDKVPLQNRIIATFIDGIIASIAGGIVGSVLAMVLPGAISSLGFAVSSALTAGIYLMRDSFSGDGMSPGKKIMKYRVVTLDGKPCPQDLSIKRNLPLAAGSLAGVVFGVIMVVPVLGPLLAFLAYPIVGLLSLGIVCAEIYFINSDPKGDRWGDKYAGTTTQKVG